MRMGGPPRLRRVGFIPQVTYFKPAGIPLRILDEVHLSVEEAEAVRLKGLEGLEQEECAEKMNISRPTLQRLLGAARKKLADALISGKAIRVEGVTSRWPCGASGVVIMDMSGRYPLKPWLLGRLRHALSVIASTLCPSIRLDGASES